MTKDIQTPELEPIEEVTDDISDVKWYDVPALLIFLALVILVWLQFFTRYVLNDSLSWTEEVSRYLLIWMTFIGGAICVRRDTQISLDFFYRYVPTSWTKPLLMLADIISLIFWGFCIYLALSLAIKTGYQKMSSVDLPKSLVYYGTALGCLMMAYFTLVNLKKHSKETSSQLQQDLMG